LSIYGGGRKYVTPKRYRNVVFDGKTGEIVYEQRNQPPVAPSSGVKAVPGIGEKKDTGISFLICYELTNSWLAHKAFSEQEKLVVWIANLSWFESQYLSDRLESVLQAWANLYGKEPHSAVMNHD